MKFFPMAPPWAFEATSLDNAAFPHFFSMARAEVHGIDGNSMVREWASSGNISNMNGNRQQYALGTCLKMECAHQFWPFQ